MPKLSVTYHAPKGDNKVVEMLGYTFHDGKAEDVEVDDRALKKLQGNPHFECGPVQQEHKPAAHDAPKDAKHDPKLDHDKDHKGR